MLSDDTPGHTAQLRATIDSSLRDLRNLSDNASKNEKVLYESYRNLQDAFNVYGSASDPEVFKLAGETLVQLLDGRMICIDTSLAGGLDDMRRLQSERDGIQSTVVQFDEWAKTQLSTKLREMRAACSIDPRLTPGTACWLWGLQASSLRNGTMGTLIKYLPAPRKRWQVEVHNLTKTGKELVAIKSENLSFYKGPEDCAICLAPIVTDCFVTSCNHFFHGACMKQATTGEWQSTGRDMALHCPTCRSWVGAKTDIGFVKRTPMELVHGVLSHTYQKIAQEIKYDDSVEAEAAITAQWHSNLFAKVTDWEPRLQTMRDAHLANPTRETGKTVGEYIHSLLEVAYGKDQREANPHAHAQGFVMRCLPEHAFKRAMDEGRNWLISLLGIYCHFLPVMGPNEHPDGVAWRCAPPESPKRGSALDVSDMAAALPQPKSLQPGGVGTGPSREAVLEAVLEDSHFESLRDTCDKFAIQYDITQGTDKWWGLRAVLHKCFADDIYPAGLIARVTMLSDESLSTTGIGFKASERIMTLIKENPRRMKDELILLKLEQDAEKMAADAEVAAINATKGGSTKKKKGKAKAKKAEPWFTKTKDIAPDPATGKPNVEGQVSIPPEVMAYADPDLLGMETANELLLFQSILQRMPKDHEHREHIEALVNMFETGQIRSGGTGESSGLSSMRAQLSMRLGPPKDKPYDPTFPDIQPVLDTLAHKCGMFGDDKLVLEKIVEETPGRHGPILVSFSMPMQYKRIVEVMI